MIDDPIDPRLERMLAAYRVPDVSADFAERVLHRLAEPPARSPSSRLLWAVVVAAIAVVIAVAWPRANGGTSEGTFVGGRRATLAVGRRGVAVAEAGAELQWMVGADSARVEQRAGDVFYRVEHGAPFRVVTPAGEVTVLGTCFRVEVETMKLSRQHVVSAGIGAAVTAVVLVTVYEGRVGFANDRGSVTLAAGEQGRAAGGSAPARVAGDAGSPLPALDPATASRDQLVAQNATARRELDVANRRIGVLENQLAMARGTREKHVAPSKDQLQAWAARCEVHIDAPDIFGADAATLSPREVTEWGVSDDERVAIERALGELHKRAVAEMREIYLAATGNSAGADELAPSAMFNEVFDKAVPGDILRARIAMARERAGLQAPPAPGVVLPPVERALRLLYRMGNDFESMLGEALSPARALELRSQYDAWPGVHYADAGCEEHAH